MFTKCGLVWNEENRLAQALRIGKPESLRREVEQSLKRLGVDQIDLYQMHWPAEDGTPIEVYWQTLLDLKQEGKVRAVGLSNHKVDRLEAAERLGHVDTLQPPFSPIRRDALAAELPWCCANNTGVIVYSPMQSGLLTGAFTEARAAALGADDWRSRSPEFQTPRLQNNLALADALRPIAARHDTTVGAVAVAWTLAAPGVTGAIVGARNPPQVDGWIAAGTLELSGADLAEIAGAIERTGAGTGPVDSRSRSQRRQSQSSVVDALRLPQLRLATHDLDCRLSSTKHILLLLAPAPLRIVSRPSVTVTVAVPSIHRVPVVGVPVTTSTPSAVVLNTLSKWVASPDTMRTSRCRSAPQSPRPHRDWPASGDGSACRSADRASSQHCDRASARCCPRSSRTSDRCRGCRRSARRRRDSRRAQRPTTAGS